MTTYFSPICNQPIVDANGAPLVGGQIFTYLAGTSTPAATFTTNAGTVQQANPIILNARGCPDNPIWLGAGVAMKLVVTDASSVTLAPTYDNVLGVNDPTAVATDQWVTYSGTPTFLSTTSLSVPGDQTPTFQVGRRVKTSNAGGTIYSTIRSSTFGGGVTTLVLLNDSGVLDAGLSAISYGLVSASNTSIPSTVFAPIAQCRLAKSGANLVLSPVNGNKIMIAGALYTIPSAGVTLVPTGNVANTGYYIYAFMSGVTMTLEFSTTAYVTDTTTGMPVKSGDTTRTLVGQAAAGGSNNSWSASVLHCLNYFNRRLLTDKASFTTGRVNSSTYPTYSETNSEIRVLFLAWADSVVRAEFAGFVSNASLGGACYSSIGFDNTGTTAEDGGTVFMSYAGSASGSPYAFTQKSGMAEATLHFATQLGAAATGNATFAGGATPISRCTLQVAVKG